MFRKKKSSIILVLKFSTILLSAELEISSSDYSARILRDSWGVPHIYGKTDADVSFGLAYAHAQDDFETIQDVYIASLGRLSELKKNRLISFKSLLKIRKKKYQSNYLFRQNLNRDNFSITNSEKYILHNIYSFLLCLYRYYL